MSWPFWAGYSLRLAAMGLALAALYAIARALRNARLRGAPNRCVSVVETTVLSPQAALHLLRVGERYLLIGATASAIAALAEVAPGDVGETRR